MKRGRRWVLRVNKAEVKTIMTQFLELCRWYKTGPYKSFKYIYKYADTAM
jgi:hypothetical protein